MLRFFRQIRQRFLTDNKFSKYLLYAIGEITLIIIGIVIALQFNEWSVKKEKEKAFQTALSQVYTDFHKEWSWYEFLIEGYQRASGLAQLELEDKLEINHAEYPKYVYYFNSLDLADFDLGNEPLLQTLQDNITSTDQRNLVNKISSHYSIWEGWNEVVNKSKITFLDELLKKYQLPFSERYTLFSFQVIHGREKVFSNAEIEKAQALMSDPAYKVALKSILNRNADLIGRFTYKLKTIKEMIAIIKEYYPNTPMTLSNVSMFGSALKQKDQPLIPLTPVDATKSEWKTRIELKEGAFRVRDGNYSIPSWGSSNDNDSLLLHNGFDIPVKAGYYEVRINFSDMNYSIKELQ